MQNCLVFIHKVSGAEGGWRTPIALNLIEHKTVFQLEDQLIRLSNHYILAMIRKHKVHHTN